MSTSNEPLQTQVNELQFDEAEYSAESPAAQQEVPQCATCKSPITDVYYEAGGKVLCRFCRDELEQRVQSGSGFARGFKALFFGSIAAAIGAILYYAIMRITGWNIGLVAVVMGVMVGGAVKAGSGNRGGRFYQLLAVFLTYSAIVAMHIPFLLEGIQQGLEKDEAAQVADAQAQTAQTAKAAPKAEIKEKAAQVADAQAQTAQTAKAAPKVETKDHAPSGKAPAQAPAAQPAKVSLGKLLLASVLIIGFFVGFAYSIPVLATFQAPISGLIFGFAIWEAWKLNRRVELAVSGPFRLATPSAAAEALEPEEAGDEP